jgi:hypothetical protein
VIRYSYLWARERKRGQDEGVKDRPCAVILVIVTEDGDRVVTVLPVTHTPPTDLALAVEIPAAVKRRLRLDDQRSWVVLTEANRFIWPGPDLRPAMPGDAASVSYGPLPFGLLEEIRTKFIGAIKARRASVVPRSE